MAFEAGFFKAFIYLAAAVVAVLLGKRIGLGAVLGYLLAGAAIGPWGFHFIGHEGQEVTHFAEFGVVMMLFVIGLELQPQMLWRMRRGVLGMGTLQVVICAAVIGLAALLFHQSWQSSLAIGLILAMSSTAIVLQTLAEKDLLRTVAGQNAFSVLLFQDIAVIPIIALLPLLGTAVSVASVDDSNAWMAAWPAWAKAVVTLAAVIAVVVLAHFGMRPVFRAIAKTRQREAFTGAALLLVIGVALLMTKVGLSPALGAFVAGVVLASSEFRHELESDLEPFKGLLLGLFFLGVGAGIDFGYVRDHPALVLGGAFGLIALKGAVLYPLSTAHGNKCAPSTLFAASLAAGGEFAFVLIALALTGKVFSAETGRALVAIVALSMAMTPLLIVAAQKFVARKASAPVSTDEREPDVADHGHPVIICGFGRYGHAVGRLLRTQGFGCTVLDSDTDQVDLLRSIGIPMHYGDASRPAMLAAAGASSARVLVIALRDAAVSLQIAEHAQRHYPHLKIFVRAHSRVEAYDFHDAKLDRIYRETLDSSLRMGRDIMETLGVDAEIARHAAERYLQRDEEMVRVMAQRRHEANDYVGVAREAVRTLDELMRQDAEELRQTVTEKSR